MAVKTDDQKLIAKLEKALKPFAHLPITADMPDDAHPAYQVMVKFVRDARKLLPDDFVVVPGDTTDGDDDTGQDEFNGTELLTADKAAPPPVEDGFVAENSAV